MCYLCKTTNIGLFYLRESKLQLFGYVDAGYLANPYKARLQTRYVFNCVGITISYR